MRRTVALLSSILLGSAGTAMAMTPQETAQVQLIRDDQISIQNDAQAIMDEPGQWPDIVQTADGIRQSAVASLALANNILLQG